jgi:hypothetical protein
MAFKLRQHTGHAAVDDCPPSAEEEEREGEGEKKVTGQALKWKRRTTVVP